MNWLLTARTSEISAVLTSDISPFKADSSLLMPLREIFSASELSSKAPPNPENDPGDSPDNSSAHWAALENALASEADACPADISVLSSCANTSSICALMARSVPMASANCVIALPECPTAEEKDSMALCRYPAICRSVSRFCSRSALKFVLMMRDTVSRTVTA